MVWGEEKLRGEKETVKGEEKLWGEKGTVKGEDQLWGEKETVKGEDKLWGEKETVKSEDKLWGEKEMVKGEDKLWGAEKPVFVKTTHKLKQTCFKKKGGPLVGGWFTWKYKQRVWKAIFLKRGLVHGSGFIYIIHGNKTIKRGRFKKNSFKS